MEKAIIKKIIKEYCNTFITIEYNSYKYINTLGGTLFKAIDIKNACYIAAGLKLSGVKSVIIVDNTMVDWFSFFCLTFCKKYHLYITGVYDAATPLATITTDTGYIITNNLETINNDYSNNYLYIYR